MEDTDRQQSYAAVLADIEKRIGDLQKAAATVKALMGLDPGDVSSGVDTAHGNSAVHGVVHRKVTGGDPLVLVKVGDFYGKSWTEAAGEFLRRAGEAQTTVTILNAMRKTQFPMKSKNPGSSLYTSLKRHKGFRLVTRNTWGLAEWYPGVEKQKPESKQIKRKAHKGKGQSKAKTAQEQVKLLQAPQ